MSTDELDIRTRRAMETFPKIQQQIGRLSIAFARLEAKLVDAISLLVDPTNRFKGDIIADRLSYSQSVDLFERLARKQVRKPEGQKMLTHLAKSLRHSAKVRNDVLHSSWFIIYGLEHKFLKVSARRRSSEGRAAPVDAANILDSSLTSIFGSLEMLEVFTVVFVE